MDEKEDMIRYAYIKNGDAVAQLREILPITENASTSGPNAFISDLVRFINHQPLLVISYFNKPSEFSVDNIQGRVFFCNEKRSGIFPKIITRCMAFFKGLFLLLNFKPDRILCGTHGVLLWISYIVSLLYSVPVVFSGHNSLLVERRPWYKYLSSKIDKLCILQSTAVICHGPYIRQQLLDIGVPSDFIFEFDIDFQDMLRQSNYAKHEPELAYRDGTVYTLYIGRIETEKGIFDLLEACTERLRKDPRTTLVYIGDGSKVKQLQDRIKNLGLTDRVMFMGRVKHESLVHAIRKARMVVTPTQGVFPEGRCMAAMESIFLGVPVVAPDSGPFPYLITNGLNGLLFKTDSIQSLKSAISRLLNDDVLYTRLCEGALQTRKKLIYPPLTFYQAVERAFSVSTNRPSQEQKFKGQSEFVNS